MALHTTIIRCIQRMKYIACSRFILVLGILAVYCVLNYDHISARLERAVQTSQQFVQAAGSNLANGHEMPTVLGRSFDPNQPKLVILLAYQRMGSSFTSQLFNQNRAMFYIFEPIDGIYSAMYGTQEGFTVPTDIAFFWNGTRRHMPSSESESVAETLGSILTCDFDKVPIEVLVHRYFGLYRSHHKRLGPYIKCFNKNHININTCRAYIKDICPMRFGSDQDKEMYCRNVLWKRKTETIHSVEHAEAFQNHIHCMNRLRQNLSSCIPLMKQVCSASNIRATKTVRLNMGTAESMLNQFNNLRLIHLIRDPRAVALSRMKNPTFRGKFSRGSIPREAQLYCSEVLKDLYVRQRIEQRFPGSVMQVIYEELVGNFAEQTRAVYSFLNETMPMEVEEWVVKNIEGAVRNSSAIADSWQTKLTFKTAKDVSDACTDMFRAINYRWPQ